MLENIAFAAKMLLGAQLKQGEVNPIDYIYDALQIKLDYLEQGDEFDLIKRYVDQTN